MKIDDEKLSIVAKRCKDGESHVKGSRIRKCFYCGEDVWISPSSEAKRYDEIICEKCHWESYDGKDDLFVTQETIDEFNSWHYDRYGYRIKTEDVLKMIEGRIGLKVNLEDTKS